MSGRRWRLGAAVLAAVTAGPPPAVAAPPDDGAARAQRNFIHHCVGCHLADGSGAPAKGIPSMRDTLGRFMQVPGGRQFIVQVPGVMNSPLDDRDIAQLMNWLLARVSAATTPPGTAPYTADEIAALRKTRPVDVSAARHALVTRMRTAGLIAEGDSSP